jgi:FADH2 O2-dependent halogenase
MNLLLEELALRYDLPHLLPFTTYGAWQKTYPHLVCGKKRGFSYFYHRAGERFQTDAEHRNQLLVAASPHDAVADTHWLRSDIDAFFVQEAIGQGIVYEEEVALQSAEPMAEGVCLRGEQRGQAVKFEAKFVFDATGPRGFLSRALALPEGSFPHYPHTQTLFSHFTGVRHWEDVPESEVTLDAPFNPDDAALHHLYEGGWMWLLRFNNGVVSAGFTATEPLATELQLADKEGAWKRFLERFPSIQAQFEGAEPLYPLMHQPQMPYLCTQIIGERWAMLPSASAFIDPLFSTGMPLTLLGIERLAHLLESKGIPAPLEAYAHATQEEALGTAAFIAGCYRAFSHFPNFVALSQFYFAAASYSEMARRVGKPHLVRRFLALDHPDFAPSLTTLLKTEQRAGALSFEEVAQAIAPLNIAGLADSHKRNWYGVDFEDTISAAHRLDTTPDALRHLFATAEWAKLPMG